MGRCDGGERRARRPSASKHPATQMRVGRDASTRIYVAGSALRWQPSPHPHGTGTGLGHPGSGRGPPGAGFRVRGYIRRRVLHLGHSSR
eukprot:scaffold578_cov235-Prasinococcus_capsulatus_cf.AAC.2